MHDAIVSAELDRLRREGQARLARAEDEKRTAIQNEASERREKDHDAVRLAVGRYRYRAIRSALFYLTMIGMPVFVLAMALIALEVASDAALPLVVGSLMWVFGGIITWDAEWVWRASRSAMREERRYLETQPFPVHGYFEWLQRSQSRTASMRLEIRGAGLKKRHDDVRLLIAAVHPQVEFDGGVFLLTEIPGRSDDRRAQVMHDLLDRVLAPLHREAPIEIVRILD